jgi:integrase
MPRRSTRSTIGSIDSVSVGLNGKYLRIGIAGKYFEDGKRVFLSLGLKDNPIDRADAEMKAALIRADILKGKFDESLDRYSPAAKRSKPDVAESISDIWDFYVNYKSASLKDSTVNYMRTGLGKLIHDCPHQSITDSLFIRNWLLEQTTSSMVKRIFTHLNAAVNWAIHHNLCRLAISPFKGMAGDLPKHKWEEEGSPNAFSLVEKSLFINKISNHQNPSIAHYDLFIRFLFMTGCRPSEAIGLRYSDIDLVNGYINFGSSIVRINGKAIRSKGSKNNKQRKFKMNELLLNLIKPLIIGNEFLDVLVFFGLKSNEIEYGYFSRNIWKPIATEICQRNTTPYSARDTFITEQLTAGIPAAKVAAWCDTSISQIQKRYFDPNRIDDLEPV